MQGYLYVGKKRKGCLMKLKVALLSSMLTYPAGLVMAQDGMIGFPVPVEVYKTCMAAGGCYVVTEEQLIEVLKSGYAEGYAQCRKESRI